MFPTFTANLFDIRRLFFGSRQKAVVKPSLILLTALIGQKASFIFLAEDDPDEREIFLEAIGDILPSASVQTADDGRDLMKLLLLKETKIPDVIFLDLNMPCKNGFECLDEIRKHEVLKAVPVIIYSGSSNPASVASSFELGATFYLPKPNSLLQLKSTMIKVFAMDLRELGVPTKEKFVLGAYPYRW
jgi:CheY-like chemotaxis protein